MPDVELTLFGEPTPFRATPKRHNRPAKPEQLGLFAPGNATPAGQYPGQLTADLDKPAPHERHP